MQKFVGTFCVLPILMRPKILLRFHSKEYNFLFPSTYCTVHWCTKPIITADLSGTVILFSVSYSRCGGF